MEQYCGVKLNLTMLSTVCQTLDSLLQSNFGPNGHSTLLATSTGQVLISNVGSNILECLHIDNPVCHTVVNSVARIHSYTGDGSKTFICYLSKIMQNLLAFSSSASSGVGFEASNGQRHALHCGFTFIQQVLLPEFVYPEIQKYCVLTNISESRQLTTTLMKNLLLTHLSSKYSAYVSDHLAETLVSFVCCDLHSFESLHSVIETLIDTFHSDCIEAEGQPPSSSCVVNGLVIQNDFVFSKPTPGPSKFVVIDVRMDLDGKKLYTYAVSHIGSLNAALSWNASHYGVLTEWFRINKINVIFSSQRIINEFGDMCSKAGIAVVQFVEREDIDRILTIYGIKSITALHELNDKLSSVIGCTEKCESVVIGKRQFIHLGNPVPTPDGTCYKSNISVEANNRITARQLIIFGMSAGACRQTRTDLHNGLKILRSWLNGGRCLKKELHMLHGDSDLSQCAVHLQGGGLFEILVSSSFEKMLRNTHILSSRTPYLDSVDACCAALHAAATAVTLRLLANSYHPRLATMAHLKCLIQTHGNVAGLNGRTGQLLDRGSRIIEPLESKMSTLSNVLNLTIQLLRTDYLLPGRKVNSIHNDSD